MNKFSSGSFEISPAEWPKALTYQVQVVVVKSGLVMRWLVKAPSNCDTAFNVVKDFPKVAASVLRSIFASDHFRFPRHDCNSFLLDSGKNGFK